MRISSILALLPIFALAPVCRATVTIYTASLNGASESPANASLATGFVTVTWDDSAHTMRVQASFSDLTAITAAAHIHGPTPTPFSGITGVATTTPNFAGFPLGVTSGTFDSTLDLTLASSFNPAFVTNVGGGTTAGAEAALKSALDTNEAYFNIHTSVFPGGEIRGFLNVPEPASLSLLTFAAIPLLTRRRVRR